MAIKRFMLILLCIAGFTGSTLSAEKLAVSFKNDAVKISSKLQHNRLPVNSNSAIAVKFITSPKWHFYADKKTAPTEDLALQAKGVNTDAVEFGQAILPEPEDYFDKTQNKNIKVYNGEFTVFLPFKITGNYKENTQAEIKIAGAYCSNVQCRILHDVNLTVKLPTISKTISSTNFKITTAKAQTTTQSHTMPNSTAVSTLAKLAMAIITGLLFNIMPCVLPVIPLIITKLLNQSQKSRAKSLIMGGGFCVGIIGFFITLAILNIILKIGFGTVLQWGDYFRYWWFIKAMSLLMIFLGLFMFGLFDIAVPSSITSKAGEGKGLAGTITMGFLAALLSTPCSFGILAGTIAWAQTQNLVISTAVFLLMGIGMAIPYAILIAIPNLLNKLPKPGNWMEYVKQAMGFILIVIAVKLLRALEVDELISTLYFAIVMSFAVWMWGKWVSFTTPKSKKIIIRLIALCITIIAGSNFLPEKKADLVDWQKYDPAVIAAARNEGQIVLIKFDAKWCASCAKVDKRVYHDREVAKILKDKNVLTVKGDTTKPDFIATSQLKNVYNEPGVPVTIIWPSHAEKPVKLRGLINKEDLINVIKTAK